MWHYIKYCFKLFVGFIIILQLDCIMKFINFESKTNFWFFYITITFYSGYCYLEYRLEDKD